MKVANRIIIYVINHLKKFQNLESKYLGPTLRSRNEVHDEFTRNVDSENARCYSKMAVFCVVAPCSLVEVYQREHHLDDGSSKEF
jgi:hypothetical protein